MNTNTRLRKLIGIDEFKKDCESPLFVVFLFMLALGGLIFLPNFISWVLS